MLTVEKGEEREKLGDSEKTKGGGRAGGEGSETREVSKGPGGSHSSMLDVIDSLNVTSMSSVFASLLP